jgi:type VI secretion system protein ImpC
MPGRLEFSFDFAKRSPAARKDSGAMRLLVVGDFSGRAAADRPPLADRPALGVDLDRLDAVVARLAPRIEVDGVGSVGFAQLDDFHPDRLYERLDVFRALRDARAQPPAKAGELLGGLLGQPVAAPPAPPSTASGIDALIRNLVAPHVVADTTNETRTYLAAVDAAIAEQMRKLLHAPAFQALEAAWRGVAWLVQNLELGEELELHVFDVTRDELLADIAASGGRLEQTGLHHALADRWRNLPDGRGWTALAGLYRFGAGDTDIGLLAALGLIASQAGGPWLAEADPALATAEPAENWQALRGSEAAPWIGLAAPRVLLRRPYGRQSDPLDAFAFEEFIGAPAHDALLWGNPALALLLLLGRGFSASGWDFDPDAERDLGDLPAVTFDADGERQLMPCAERLLGEKAAQTMLGAGLIALASHKNRNAVTLLRWQSIADPPAALAGFGR